MDWGIIGHEWAVNLLAQHAALGKERHAYLITGPSGVGRRTLALRFTQALNCLQPPSPGEPCRKCTACQRIERMQHPDLSVVEAEREGQVLRIEQIRDLQHTLSLAPYEARYRVALILRFEEANNSAANAMLKTLEEPPERVVVILTASSAESLLPTIASRCEMIRLRALSTDETAKGLQAIKQVPQELSEKLAHLSDGRPGYAIKLFETPSLLQERRQCLDELLRLLASSRRERLAYAKEASENKVEIRQELRDKLVIWLTFWRDVLITTAGVNTSLTNMEYSQPVKKLAASLDIHKAQAQVNALERTLEDIDRNVNSRLALEILLMDFPKINTLP